MNMLATIFLLLADILTGTWNLRWFPSGRAEHRAEPAVEQANLQMAADTLRARLAARGRDSVILFLEELRDADTAAALVSRIGDTNLTVAAVSAFREYDGRLGWQQVAIVTDLPVLDGHFAYWRRPKKVFPPRGYAYALLDGGARGPIACYGVHLKSNYGAVTAEKRADNSLKREVCAQQLADLAKKLVAPDGRLCRCFLIGGDFNVDPFARRFADEKTFPILYAAGYRNCFEGAAREERATYAASGRYAGSTLDFILYKGFESPRDRALAPAVPVSDHRFLTMRFP